jgi:probable rRNA maturation factor
MSSRSAHGRPARNVTLQIHARIGAAHVPFLRRHLAKTFPLLSAPLRQVSLALVGDALMSKLHEQFMGIPGPTDVLTFELEHDPRGKVVEGEVVICVPEARRRAREHAVPPEHELLLYAIHGLLHLSGYDDRTQAGFRAMHREEDRILGALGVGPVFAPGHGAAIPARKVARGISRKKDGRSR